MYQQQHQPINNNSSPNCLLDGCVLIETSYGNLSFALYGIDCPRTTSNFLQLCTLGFYDGCYIPRVVRNGFFEVRGHHEHVQEQNAESLISELTGMNNNNNNNNDNSIANTTAIPLEINHQLAQLGPLLSAPNLQQQQQQKRSGKAVTASKQGLLVMMGNSVTNDTKSSFLITTTQRRLDYLDRKHVILGEIIWGPNRANEERILREINALALKNPENGGENSVLDGTPIRRIHIKRIHVLESSSSLPQQRLDLCKSLREKFFIQKKLVGEDDSPLIRLQGNNGDFIHNYKLLSKFDTRNLQQQQQRFQKPKTRQNETLFFLSSGEDDDDDQGNRDPLQIELKQLETKIRKRRDDETQKVIMQLIGERPSDDPNLQPPDNVLFVCKLNPLTQDDDLADCFKSFGKILSCEIIRDKKTGRSLQYAFIEFDTADACAAAFKKMDRVKIDDARIHVDFSQSLGRIYWANKRPQPKQQQQYPTQQQQQQFGSFQPQRRQQDNPGYYPPPQQQKQQEDLDTFFS